MKIHWKITLLLISALLTLALLSAFGTHALLRTFMRGELVSFTADKRQEAKRHLQEQVEVAEGVVLESLALFKAGQLDEAGAKKRALDTLAQIRYDNGAGYFWVNDTAEPLPAMVMHPISPALNGKTMDDPKYNCAMGKRQNLFQAMVEVSAKGGDGFVDYLWPKPNSAGVSEALPKISYVKRIAPWGWMVGTGVYVDSIDAAVAQKEEASSRNFTAVVSKILLLDLVILVVVAIAMALFVVRTICNPIMGLVQFVNDIAGGNLTRQLIATRQDEIGMTLKAIANMVKKIGAIFKAAANNADTLTLASSDLLEISTDLSGGLTTMSDRYTAIAGAAEEMRANMQSISAAMEESSSTIAVIAHSATNMERGMDTISGNTAKAKQVTDEVATMATRTTDRLADLGDAAEEITKISATITEISEKTNLLALNATIEAARAGEAGKGFAVVASEIKELANSVASSTKEIRGKVDRVQTSTSATVKDIQAIIGGIDSVSQIVTGISAEMEGHKAATRDIVQSIAQTAQGVNEITRNVAQSTEANRSVAEDLAHITDVSRHLNSSSLELKDLSADINQIAQTLSTSVHQFDLGERKFDIAAIKRAHLRWKKNLVTVLSGKKKIRADEVTHHTKCDFGQWYFGQEGQVFASLELFQEIGRHHEHVHTYAREIVELYNAGKAVDAERKLATFEDARKKLFGCLDRMYLS
jgi:methyl-accepting chemotaxis protein